MKDRPKSKHQTGGCAPSTYGIHPPTRTTAYAVNNPIDLPKSQVLNLNPSPSLGTLAAAMPLQTSERTPHHLSRGAWYFLINCSIYRMTEAGSIKQAIAFEHGDKDA